MQKTMNYYVATVKGGHVGEKYYIDFHEPIMALTKKEAAEICKTLPRAKKGQKDLIRGIRQVSHEEYTEICRQEQNNPYKFSKNIQEQRKYMSELEEFIKPDPAYKDRDLERKINKSLKTPKNKKKYVNRYVDNHNDWKRELNEYIKEMNSEEELLLN